MLRTLVSCVLLLVGCNEVYDLDKTTVAPPDVDRDLDGISDSFPDNCPLIANADQRDDDDDGLGNACDLCPAIASASNHNEDGDATGDECDLCPTRANFDLDTDRDGVGDDCDNDFASQNRLLLFDAFTSLDPVWQPVAAPWVSTGDAAVASEPGTELRHTTLLIDGSRSFWIHAGLTSTSTWQAGDRFGLALVDASGAALVRCVVDCPFGNCTLARDPDPGDPSMSPPHVPPVPTATFALNHTFSITACVHDQTTHGGDRVVFETAQLAVIGSPRIHVRYIAVWQ